jgi:hypothetical protein
MPSSGEMDRDFFRAGLIVLLALGACTKPNDGAGGGPRASQGSGGAAGSGGAPSGGDGGSIDGPVRPDAMMAPGSGGSSATGGATMVPPPAVGTNGSSCGADGDCGSGHCVSGICCASTCDKGAESACGLAGTCDASGACKKYGAETVCAPETCDATAGYTPPRLCDGQGTCQPAAAPRSCLGFPCQGPRCRMNCLSAGDCAAGNYCANGMCVAKKSPGSGDLSCQDGAECMSGFCVDHVCCNEACTGTCRSCTMALTGKPDGTCLPTLVDTRSDDCPAASESSCKNTGACDGKGACQQYGSNVTCAQPTCSGDSAVAAASCDGKGKCGAGKSTGCNGYTCRGSQCLGRCGNDGDCAGSRVCLAGQCRTLLDAGGKCSSGDACKSARCTDGICCTQTCASGETCVKNGVCRLNNGEPCTRVGGDECVGKCMGNCNDPITGKLCTKASECFLPDENGVPTQYECLPDSPACH